MEDTEDYLDETEQGMKEFLRDITTKYQDESTNAEFRKTMRGRQTQR